MKGGSAEISVRWWSYSLQRWVQHKYDSYRQRMIVFRGRWKVELAKISVHWWNYSLQRFVPFRRQRTIVFHGRWKAGRPRSQYADGVTAYKGGYNINTIPTDSVWLCSVADERLNWPRSQYTNGTTAYKGLYPLDDSVRSCSMADERRVGRDLSTLMELQLTKVGTT